MSWSESDDGTKARNYIPTRFFLTCDARLYLTEDSAEHNENISRGVMSSSRVSVNVREKVLYRSAGNGYLYLGINAGYPADAPSSKRTHKIADRAIFVIDKPWRLTLTNNLIGMKM